MVMRVFAILPLLLLLLLLALWIPSTTAGRRSHRRASKHQSRSNDENGDKYRSTHHEFSGVTSLRSGGDADVDDYPEWEDYLKRYGTVYESEDERTQRQTIYESNAEYIKSHNSQHDQGLKNFRLGINEFSDLTTEEFADILNGHQPLLESPSDFPPVTRNFRLNQQNKGRGHNKGQGNKGQGNKGQGLPSTVDWKQKGYLTEVKNQGRCGSCWAFAAATVVESHLGIITGQMVSLSEQNLVDCSSSYGNQECSGGNAIYAYKYIRDNGIESSADYPYNAKNGSCMSDPTKIVTRLTGYGSVPAGNETALQEALSEIGPISVAIDASLKSFQFYKSGIYDDQACSSKVDHGVVAVGYGTMNGSDYWLVRNSWGSSWGQGGYVYMARNANNLCGIAKDATYPIM